MVADMGGRAVSIAVVPVLLQHVKRGETRDVRLVELRLETHCRHLWMVGWEDDVITGHECFGSWGRATKGGGFATIGSRASAGADDRMFIPRAWPENSGRRETDHVSATSSRNIGLSCNVSSK